MTDYKKYLTKEYHQEVMSAAIDRIMYNGKLIDLLHAHGNPCAYDQLKQKPTRRLLAMVVAVELKQRPNAGRP